MFQAITMEISKRENKEFKKLGEVTAYVPLLKDIVGTVAEATIAKDEKGNDKIEDGIPVFADDKANWIQGAILAAVKAQVRNKLKPGTAEFKDGQKSPENWEELCAEGQRGGAAALALAREFKEKFAEWVGKQGISEAAANTLVTLVKNRDALSLQAQGVKDKVKARLDGFAESLSAEDLEKFMRPLEAAQQACEAVEETMDF